MREKPGFAFLTEADARPQPGDLVFRERRTGKLALSALLLGLVAGGSTATWLVAAQDNPSNFLALFFAQMTAALFFVFLISFNAYRASGQPGNWRLRASPQGLFVHYRSYLNRHLPGDHPTVVFLPHAEIEGIRASRWQHIRSLPDEDCTERRDCLEIGLRHADLSPLAKALAEQRRLLAKAKSRHNHYPVEIADTAIRIEWKSPRTAIAPDLEEALRLLGASYPVAAAEGVLPDGDETLTDAGEREQRILEYLRRGDVITATKLARLYYGYDLAEARGHVAALEERL